MSLFIRTAIEEQNTFYNTARKPQPNQVKMNDSLSNLLP